MGRKNKYETHIKPYLKKIPKWYSDGLTKTKTAEERRTWRSKTFPGFAKAMAEQWSKELTK